MDDLEHSYELLGLKRGATIEDVERAYRFLATAFHPDKFASPELKQRADARMKEINRAHDVILNHLRERSRREAEQAHRAESRRGRAEHRGRREADERRSRATQDWEGPGDEGSRIWRMFYAGAGAYQRGDRARARELLTEVAQRAPGLVLDGRPVETWLRMNESWRISPHERYYLRLALESAAFGGPGLLLFIAGARTWGLAWIAFTVLLVIFRLQSSERYLRGFTAYADQDFDRSQE